MKNKRFLLAKPGLDGHDKGVRLVAMALRNAGVDVRYLGLRQSIDSIVQAAVENEVNIIGLSILSGVHLSVAQKALEKMREAGISHIPLVIGGIIPPMDVEQLLEMGISAVFPVGSSFGSIIQWVEHFEPQQVA